MTSDLEHVCNPFARGNVNEHLHISIYEIQK